MRKIKFRGWDTKHNKMWTAEELSRDELPLSPNGRGFINVDSVSSRLSQYLTYIIPLEWTGLRDRLNKEIYEGDIIQNENCFGCISKWGDAEDHFPDRRVVIWDAENAQFTLDFIEDSIKGRGCSGYGLCATTARQHFEVVGNIYEDPCVPPRGRSDDGSRQTS